jgi:phosphoribosylformylglycinamidine synthase
MAVSDCLNFGSPEDPDVMWQFAEATRGLADGCRELGIPVTGGNVSLYNQTGETAILPTPVVAVLGVIDDVTRRTPSGFVAEGQQIYLLGTTRDELSGSEWASVVHGHLGGLPPAVDLAAEKQLADILINASRDGLIDAAHDLSEGGLAQALVESCLRNNIGARVWIPDGVDPFVALFSESSARAIVCVPRSEEVRFTDMCTARGFPHVRVGVTDGTGEDAVLDVQDQFSIGLTELREAWSGTLPAALSVQ